MPNDRAVIFANGILPDLQAARKILLPGDVYFAADAGAVHILRLGFLPELVIGDMDSIPYEELQVLKNAKVHFLPHPTDKDLTDLELALNTVLVEGYHRLLIVAGLGGRLDMTLSNLNLLARPDLAGLEVSMDDGVEQVLPVRHKVTVKGKAGDSVSLLPWGGPIENVSTSGLRWTLTNAHLDIYETRAVSNEMLSDLAEIQVGSGFLLVIHRRNSFPGKEKGIGQ